jgi:hypothetical protein
VTELYKTRLFTTCSRCGVTINPGDSVAADPYVAKRVQCEVCATENESGR